MATFLSERTEQTLAFLISLPVTIKENTAAKILANLGAFFLAGLPLTCRLIAVILTTKAIPNAYAPLALIVLVQALVLNCVFMAVTLVSESSGATMAVGVVGNILFWFSFALIGVVPGMGDSQAACGPRSGGWSQWKRPRYPRSSVSRFSFNPARRTSFVESTPAEAHDMRYIYLFALLGAVLGAGPLHAQDGAALYAQRCAQCHDKPTERIPSLATIKTMNGAAIYVALTTGNMRTQAQGLGTAEIFALLGYIAPTGGNAAAPTFARTCKGSEAFAPRPGAPAWNGWSPSLTNSRYQGTRAAGLTARQVPRLKLKWAFNLGAVTEARGQPVVVGGRVFAGTSTGAFYALDQSTGCTYWGFKAAGGLRGGVTLGDAGGRPAVFFGDTSANVYALDAATGKLLWKVHPVSHFASFITATPAYRNGVLYQPISSFEEALGPDPKFECCTFRGSVVALDAATGKKRWQTYTIAEAPKPTRKSAAGTQLHGPSGAAIWSSPTIDAERGALYVATGDNYSDPPTATSDAVLAMSLDTGKLLWSHQLTPNDAYNNGCAAPPFTNCPAAKGPDFDFGQPPILVDLGRHRSALVIAQKSGFAYGLDPDRRGALLWQTRVGKGSALGGSQWGSASDGRQVYVAVSDLGIRGVPDKKAPQGYRLVLDPRQGGGLAALDPKTGKLLWQTKPAPCAADRTDCSPAQSAAVSAIPGAVFSGSVDGHLRAYSSRTGQVIWDVDTARQFKTVNGKPARGGSFDATGPAIVDGTVFAYSGYAQWGGMPGNVLLAFSVDGK